jgi:hypothetical protein
MKLEFSLQIFEKSRIKFHENPLTGGEGGAPSRSMWTDRRTDLKKLTFPVHNFADAPDIVGIDKHDFELRVKYAINSWAIVCVAVVTFKENHSGHKMCESVGLGRHAFTTSKTFEYADATWTTLPLWIYLLEAWGCELYRFLGIISQQTRICRLYLCTALNVCPVWEEHLVTHYDY